MSVCNIVLIEDNPGDVFLVERALKELDITCDLTTFSNGQEALKRLCPPEGTGADHQVLPDAILLDLNTPKSDGFEVLSRLRGNVWLAHVPIAIITSSQATSDMARASRLGAIRYIQKPSHLDEFITKVGGAIREMLGEKLFAEQMPIKK